MKISVVTGSRADYGLLEWPIRLLKQDSFFTTEILNLWGDDLASAYHRLDRVETDLLLVLGDRYEILGITCAAHLKRIPIAHIGGGDVTEGSYDDAMRDAISRMAAIHFVTSTSAMARLTNMGYRNVHLVGSPGIDYIKHAQWKTERPYGKSYVVVSYQPETLDGTNDIEALLKTLPSDKRKIFIMPNNDRGSDAIRRSINQYLNEHDNCVAHNFLPHDEFLNLIYHCDEFIGNSSAMLYEAPELEVKTRMIGKRQRGRVIPWGDGHASERIIKVLKYSHL